jgi:hypothetical protein
MKKYFLLVLSVFLCAPLVKAQNGGGEEPPEIIIIWDGGSVGGTPIHHAPAQIPIQAAYSSSHSTIFVNFLYDLGYVSVEIENITTGTFSQTTVNAAQGIYPFMISGASGIYEITFTLANGGVYIGSFQLE